MRADRCRATPTSGSPVFASGQRVRAHARTHRSSCASGGVAAPALPSPHRMRSRQTAELSHVRSRLSRGAWRVADTCFPGLLPVAACLEKSTNTARGGHDENCTDAGGHARSHRAGLGCLDGARRRRRQGGLVRRSGVDSRRGWRTPGLGHEGHGAARDGLRLGPRSSSTKWTVQGSDTAWCSTRASRAAWAAATLRAAGWCSATG